MDAINNATDLDEKPDENAAGEQAGSGAVEGGEAARSPWVSRICIVHYKVRAPHIRVHLFLVRTSIAPSYHHRITSTSDLPSQLPDPSEYSQTTWKKYAVMQMGVDNSREGQAHHIPHGGDPGRDAREPDGVDRADRG